MGLRKTNLPRSFPATAACRAGALANRQPFYQRAGQAAHSAHLPSLQAL